MLYELIAVVNTFLIPMYPYSRTNECQVRPGNLAEVKEIARTAGSLILRSGGTIRGIKNWGVFNLPKRTRKHQALYTNGHYFIMRYDSSSKIQDDVRTTLGLDPRMIKFSSVKLGDGTLESLSKISGDVDWQAREEI
ncbi:37S ribosomal protein MRP17 [Lachnellula suecica]|uniref:Small ribosomal subunit protein bS6m n=1 Tax=Lachnellula suecica TaxID=602035 RepID=A0A8T9CHH7_9HELO|nr:37S ribosomal protein MRP17 [Lachnellula suecica]